MASTVQQMLREVAEQTRQLTDFARKLPEIHRDTLSEAVIDGYRDIIETSPVRTGAYRAEHVIEQGSEEGGSLLYEADNRPGPDAPVTSRFSEFGERGGSFEAVQFDAPSVDAARNAVADAKPYETIQIANRRFYAPDLEFGNSNMEPRYIYESAGVRSRAFLEELARRISDEMISD